MTTTTGRRTLGAIVAIAALTLGACGVGAEDDGIATARDDTTTTDTAPSGDAEASAPLDADAQALLFAACVRDNGVEMPDPAPGQQGLVDAFQAVAEDYDRATLEAALSTCQGLLPQFEEQRHPPGDDFILRVAECLREQGLDVSDNPFQDAHSGGVDVNEFSAAMEVCNDVLAGGGR